MIKYANSQFWDGSRSLADKGLWPRQIELRKGTVLYRFIDVGRMPSIDAADGPWWLEYEHYQTIKQFALRNGYPLGYSARLFAAILYEWSEVNAVVRAEIVSGPLLAWKGKGKQVTASKTDARDVSSTHGVVTNAGSPAEQTAKMTPMSAGNEIYQLFIPGLGRPHFQFKTMMRLLRVEQIQTG